MKMRSTSPWNPVPAQLAAPLLCAAWICLVLPLSAQAPGCLPTPAGAVGWWPLDGTVEDLVGTGSATTAGNPEFVAGEVGQGLRFDQVNDPVRVPASPALDVGAGDGLTVELWVSPADLSRQNPLVEWSDGQSVLGMHFWTSVKGDAAPAGGPGSLFANLLDTAGQAHFLSTASGLLAANQFQHVALTYSKTIGQARMYLNGQIVLDQFVGQFTPETRTAIYFGWRTMAGERFRGTMDEIGIYNRALTFLEIQAIYVAGQQGKCKTSQPPAIVDQPRDRTVMAGGSITFSVSAFGAAPLSYQWRFNGADIEGALGASLTIADVQAVNAGKYSVVVSNPLGTVTSADAVLAVKPGDSLVVPSGFATRAGGWGGTGLLNETLRMHLVYGAANFPTGPIAIQEIGVRPYTGFHPFSATIAKVEIRLSTTQVQPDNLSRTFAGNFGSDTTLVYSGPLSISSAFTGPAGGPKDFDIVIPLQAPFVYDPSLGNLLVELKNFTGLSTGNFVDFSNDATDNASRMWASSSLDASVAEATDSYADILQLIYEPARMDGPAKIVSQPQDQMALAGGSITFAVSASGAAPLSYQWRFNGANIDGAIGASLTIADAQAFNAGKYSVVVSNPLGTVTSTEAVLTVTPAPTDFDLNRDFSTAKNPGGVWSYGWVGQLGGPFTLLEAKGVTPDQYGLPIPFWALTPNSEPAAYWNNNATIAYCNSRQGVHLPGDIWFFAGHTGAPQNFGVIRFTAPSNGLYRVNVAVKSYLEGSLSGDTDFHVLKSGVELFGQFLPSQGATNYTNTVGLASGDTLDFAVGRGQDGSLNYSGLTIRGNLEPVGELQPRAPVILRQPLSQTVVAGNAVSFQVVADGASPFTYQWWFNGDQVSGATNATLTLGNALAESAGRYTVVVANALGSVTSDEAVLTVNPAPVPPTITTQPVSQTVLPGSSVTFSVSVSGTAPLSYRWQFNGRALPGATNRTLTLANVQSANAGNYRVVVANAAGSVLSAEAALVLQSGPQPPAILAQSGPVVASPGGLAILWVSAAGGEPLSYQWFFNGTVISGATTSSLTLSSVQPSQAGIYTVTITNPYGAVTNSGILLNVVDGAGGGTVDFKNLSPDMGMVYDVDGVTGLVGPAYSVQLYAGLTTEGLQPVGAPTGFLSVPGRFSGGVRVVATVPPEQTGWFQVRAWESAYGRSYEEARAAGGKNGVSGLFQVKTANPNAAPPSPPARLSGMPSFALAPGGPITPPEITTQPQGQTVPLGAVASLSVAATGTAPLRYQWYLGDGAIEWASGASLAFTNAQPASAGDYRVVVSNAGGSVTSQVAALTVQVDRIFQLTCPADPQPEGNLVIVPLVLVSQGEVAGLSFNLNYDPNYLALPEMAWDRALDGAFKQAYESAPGQLWSVFAFGSGALPAGTRTVGVLTFRARTVTEAAASELQLQVLDISGTTGEPILYGTEVRSGTVRLASTGSTDNNVNGIWDAGDVTLLLRLITRMETIRSWDITRNDLNHNGVLDSGDVILLLRAAAETAQPDEGQVNPAALLAERASLTPARPRGEAGQLVTWQVRLDSLIQPVVAADLTLSYPAAAVRLSSAQAPKAGSLMPSSTLLTCKDDGLGKLRLVLSSPGMVGGIGVHTAQFNGVLAEVTFEVLPGAASQYAWPLGLSRVEAWADGYTKRGLLGSGAVMIGRNPQAGKLVGLRQAAGEFRLSLTGDAGADYVVEVSDDLEHWTAWQTVTAEATGLEVLDTDAVNLPKRFYRTRPVEYGSLQKFLHVRTW
jgi:hypothetical protein